MTKLWVNDKMYMVDEEVYEYVEKLEKENIAMKKKVEELKNKKPFSQMEIAERQK